LAESAKDFVIEHGLRNLRVRTGDGQWIVTIEEPWLYDPDPDLKTTIEEFDL
jgi:hypothetical protein